MALTNYEFVSNDANYNNVILRDTTRILINDNNLKPTWIKSPAAFSEFFIQRNKKTLLVVIGESWTYGESLPGVATALGKFDIFSQLMHGMGSKMALTLDADLYQYAVPGNCNLFMFEELGRILDYVSKLGYRQIYVCQQMTEQGRDNSILPNYPTHPLNNLYREPGLFFEDFLMRYDEIFCEIYAKLIYKYNQLTPMNAILWRNFCKLNTRRRDYPFKIIEPTWIEYSAKILGIPFESPKFYVAGWIQNLQQHYSNNINFNLTMLNAELDKVEQSNDLIKSNPLHNAHPNTNGHSLWANYLIRNAGWRNDI